MVVDRESIYKVYLPSIFFIKLASNHMVIHKFKLIAKCSLELFVITSSLQFDVFFAECNTPIETVQNTSTELKDAMNNFKRACSVAGVTSSAKASLEECIDGLKQLIRTDDDEDALEVTIALFEVIKCSQESGKLAIWEIC